MKIEVYCDNCGGDLKIIEEYSSRGVIVIAVEPCTCKTEFNEKRKENVKKY